MDHVAIDLGGSASQICIRSEDGTILEERRCPTGWLKKYLAQRQRSLVVLESCAEAFAVADVARELGHEVNVVPATLAPALGVGARGLKSDVRDARNLSEASCRMVKLPSVHIPSTVARERKSICGLRENLVEVRTKLVNGVRGGMRAEGLGTMKVGHPESFPGRVEQHVTRRERAIPAWVARNLATIQHLSEQVSEADAELMGLAKADPICRRLMTVPGVGPVTAVRFAAAVDDASRFPNAHAVESYLGLTPGEHSSGEHKRSTAITKAGAPKLRWALVQAAWNARRYRRQDPMVLWASHVEARRGKTIAVVALARKMAGVLYAVWRDDSVYDPKHQTGEVEPT
jgi:transposase